MALCDNVKHRRIYCGNDCNAAGSASGLEPAGCFCYWMKTYGELWDRYAPAAVKPGDGVGDIDERRISS